MAMCNTKKRLAEMTQEKRKLDMKVLSLETKLITLQLVAICSYIAIIFLLFLG